MNAVESAGGDTDRAGEVDPFLHQGIQNTGSVKPAESTALQNHAALLHFFCGMSARKQVNAGIYLILHNVCIIS